MTTTLVGIDPSLTACGVAILRHPTIADTPNRPQLHTIGESLPAKASANEQDARIERVARRVLKVVPQDTELVVIEGPSYGSRHGLSAERMGLYRVLRFSLRARKIPIATCPPQTRAKFATGAGNADKTAVLDAMRHHWTTADIRDHNQADALAMATAGAMRLLWWPTEQDHHEDALAAIEWPEQVKADLAQRIKAGW